LPTAPDTTTAPPARTTARGCTLLAGGLAAAVLAALCLLIAIGDASSRLSGAPTRSALPDLVTYGSPALLLALVVYLAVRAAVVFHGGRMAWLGRLASLALLGMTFALVALPVVRLMELARLGAHERRTRRSWALRAAERQRWQDASIVVAGPAPGTGHQPLDFPIVIVLDNVVPREQRPQLRLSRRDRHGGSRQVAGHAHISPTGRQITFVPEHLLRPGARYTLTLDPAPGNPRGVLPRALARGWVFTTEPEVPRHLPVRPGRVRAHVPTDGRSTVMGTPGALPSAVPGEPRWGVFFDVDRCGMRCLVGPPG